MISRAFSNLVKNSAEAGAGNVRIGIKEGMNEATLFVEDDGPGLSSHQVASFLKGRGKSTKRDRYALGLSTVNHVARNHGGKVVYKQSTLGGALFEIRISDNPQILENNTEVMANA